MTMQTITMTTQWGRDPAAVTEGVQINYLLIDLQSAAVPVQAALNLCLLLDRSGSMQGAKISALRAAVARVIDRLAPTDVVSVVLFDEQAEVIVPAAPLTDRQRVLAACAAISEQGGTALGRGLAEAEQQVLRHADPDRLSRLVLLTDGQTWGDEAECRQLAERLAAAGIPIIAYGLGDDWNAQLLEDLAATGGGQADYIEDAAGIDGMFQAMVRRAQSTALQRLRLVVRPAAGVECRAAHRSAPLVQSLALQPGPDGLQIAVGDLAAGTTQQLLLDLLVPARPAGEYRMLSIQCYGQPLGQGEQLLGTADVLLTLTDNAGQIRVQAPVMNTAERVSAFKLQTRALSELELGDRAGATRSLRAAATRLLDLGELEHAARVEAQVQQLEDQQSLSAGAEKTLRYVTRRLTQRLDEMD